MDRKLLCYAYGREGQWQAICIDLDLAVYGETFQEVKQLLEEVIVTYVEDALQEDEAVAQELLNRRAPLSVRASAAFAMLMHWLRRNRSANDNSYAGFDIPCHA